MNLLLFQATTLNNVLTYQSKRKIDYNLEMLFNKIS